MKGRAVIGLAFASVMLVTAFLALSCSCGKESGESSAIKETIRGYFSSYNARDYEQCLTYFAGYGDRAGALSELAFLRELSGELTLVSIGSITIKDATATAEVTGTIAGQTGTDLMKLSKEGSRWKILWEQ